ncbi:MAG: Ubiquinone/menaquinone biosynthesis C-methyltransferase UbiE [Chlamydiia bacterium]|nr:Ubiquinone/menaquinone biosynthesis C-methyltransferase UbiE [Chlamydiia bacterium]MCH9615425.1 Ubiquinone/menaquinone biosynthesis C-methyltransferase UbiE [Chlamydiia bacterium]MCH9628253.1 Ubiquinone/menaquinone biosynthesis C-methyltransferase UbiE [Chlamydiia bacterium]
MEKVETPEMFNRISSTYDRLNRILSLGLDLYWRKKVADFLPDFNSLRLVDLATGTGDQILSLFKRDKRFERAVGIDPAADMLSIGRRKIAGSPFANQIEMVRASADELPIADESVEAVTMSFGIRNVPDPAKVMEEAKRILVKDGRLIILEFSEPSTSLIKRLHGWYLLKILPKIGKFFSGDDGAYQYLPESIETFPSGERFLEIMRSAGLKGCSYYPLSFGTVTIYVGQK